MDSLTQITLGAAIGEVTLGKKLGNRAMMWGAVAGTIPDLDVIANFFMDDMGALAFHRGFTHSIVFALLMPWLIGWLVWRLYESEHYKTKLHKILASIFGILFLGFVVVIFNLIFRIALSGWNPVPILFSAGVSAFLIYRLWKNYLNKELDPIHVSYRDWVWFFFLTIITHPILDCFTAFGTQLFEPFSNYRVSWDNISVADPMYTVWYILFLVPTCFLLKTNKKRKTLAWLALSISGVYMIFTLFNKQNVSQIFEKSLAANGIEADRYMTSPSILSNILWNGVAETDSAYYFSNYSLFDKKEEFINFHKINKDYSMLDGHENDRAIKILKWFSNGYFNITKNSDENGDFWQLNDLRYGTRDGTFDESSDYIFKFKLIKKENGEFDALDNGRPKDEEDMDFSPLFKRWRGI